MPRDAVSVFTDALAEVDVDIRKVAAKWARLLDAKKRIPIVNHGRVTDVFEDDDAATQLRAADRLTEVFGGYPAKSVRLEGAFRVEQLHELAVRLDALPPERLAALAAGQAPIDVEALPAPAPAEDEA